ncbi:uncharacterized protein LOC125671634 isoform X1 [Ostrea edulis]|uniref:uncharacterized protein LOC125671634 isoform X1 n=1 Tax=Ostrea edulis TaxID=37623 RepID=UPI0024AED23F|nr:uncharacterized protein LOC125671634 isoform X1 [Ostrea edulis]
MSSDCARITCSKGESPICYQSKCLCRRHQGYCSTDVECGYGDCGPDYRHHCHQETHTCGCIHASHHDIVRCTGDGDCRYLHCEHHHDHYQRICDSGECHCMKTIHVPECDHHHENHCPRTMCASSYTTVCLQYQCTCLREPRSQVCHSDADCNRIHNCSSHHSPRCVRAVCTCVVSTTTDPRTPVVTSEMPTVSTTTDPRTPIVTSEMSTALQYTTTKMSMPTVSGTTPHVLCPECNEVLNCTWKRTCPPSQTCMIRSYSGFNFTVHCSVRDDCHFIQSVLPTSEIYCCDDSQCLHTYLGI